MDFLRGIFTGKEKRAPEYQGPLLRGKIMNEVTSIPRDSSGEVEASKEKSIQTRARRMLLSFFVSPETKKQIEMSTTALHDAIGNEGIAKYTQQLESSIQKASVEQSENHKKMSGGASITSISKEANGEPNEDSFGSFENVIVIADGVGGEGQGNIASQFVVSEVRRRVEGDETNGIKKWEKNTTRGEAKKELMKMYEEILADFNTKNIPGRTTLTVSREIEEPNGFRFMVFLHVGDSGGFRFNVESKKLESITQEDSVMSLFDPKMSDFDNKDSQRTDIVSLSTLQRKIDALTQEYAPGKTHFTREQVEALRALTPEQFVEVNKMLETCRNYMIDGVLDFDRFIGKVPDALRTVDFLGRRKYLASSVGKGKAGDDFRPKVYETLIEAGDIFFLATDLITDVNTTAQLNEVVSTTTDEVDASEWSTAIVKNTNELVWKNKKVGAYAKNDDGTVVMYSTFSPEQLEFHDLFAKPESIVSLEDFNERLKVLADGGLSSYLIDPRKTLDIMSRLQKEFRSNGLPLQAYKRAEEKMRNKLALENKTILDKDRIEILTGIVGDYGIPSHFHVRDIAARLLFEKYLSYENADTDLS